MDSWQQISAYSPHPRTQSAPLPPRQTRSYASAIKRSDTPPQSDIAVERIGSVPLSIRTDT
uniref:Uncharacterized protein n=1 Tax=Heterorhabditis bacteriophora TaxID=37862 RepID=A0A1I7XV08_HETBA